MGGYALEAHREYINLLAEINQHVNGRSKEDQSEITGGESDPIPAPVRIAYVRWEGAWARAYPIDNETIQVCLSVLSSDMDGVMETEIGVADTYINIQDRVAEAEMFADMIARYISDKTFTKDQKILSDKDGNQLCNFLSFRWQ